MSFLTEYFDEYRLFPLKKVQPCRPEDSWVKYEGKWLDPKVGNSDVPMTDEEIRAFILKAMRSCRGQSVYFTDYCEKHPKEWGQPLNIDPDAVPKKKTVLKDKGYRDVASQIAMLDLKPPMDLKDTEVMKKAKSIYERDMEALTLKPNETHSRIYGYCRRSLYRTGISDYMDGIGKLAYELVRDNRIPKLQLHNGHRPKWGSPPEGVRQPPLDGCPYDGERYF